MQTIFELLTTAVTNNASDIHLSSYLPPIIRIDGELERLPCEPLDKTHLTQLLYNIMSEKQQHTFEQQHELDFVIAIPELARFRVNIFLQEKGISGVFRIIPSTISTLEDIDAPEILKQLCTLKRGLVLVTGPTGSGKSTTLAAMINHINCHKKDHILTVEDPIEFVHESKSCLVSQREVHRDTHSFSDALRSALREDPDIILVGEMRDLETIRLALTAAETGHLVFATLHTSSAAKTINRIIDVFPAGEKSMVRSMLSESLQAVISQTLIKKLEGTGQVAASEIMIRTGGIANLIREDKLAQVYSAIQTGQSLGMRTLDQHLKQLVTEGIISIQVAREMAQHKENFN